MYSGEIICKLCFSRSSRKFNAFRHIKNVHRNQQWSDPGESIFNNHQKSDNNGVVYNVNVDDFGEDLDDNEDIAGALNYYSDTDVVEGNCVSCDDGNDGIFKRFQVVFDGGGCSSSSSSILLWCVLVTFIFTNDATSFHIILNMVQHNGRYCCKDCLIEGKHVPNKKGYSHEFILILNQ